MDQPRPGKCNANLGNNRYCGADPEPGATRCRVHGGANQAASGLRESLYTKRLRQSLKSPEDQKLFDEMPKVADLSEEIRVARMRVLRYEEMLNNGEEWIWTHDNAGGKKPLAQSIAEDGEADVKQLQCKALSVHDLHRDALQSLRALVVSQKSIHPGSDLGGNLRVTITLAGPAKPRLPIPDLTDDSIAQRLLPAVGPARDVDGVRVDRPAAGKTTTGYEDD